MMAITVWQPWASLIALGHKPYEFRRWTPGRHQVGKPIAIHAGARSMRTREVEELLWQVVAGDKGAALRCDAEEMLRQIMQGLRLPLSHVVCTATLGQPIRATDLPHEWADSDRADHHVWAWPMLDVQPLTPPEPATGKQGLWSWSA